VNISSHSVGLFVCCEDRKGENVMGHSEMVEDEVREASSRRSTRILQDTVNSLNAQIVKLGWSELKSVML
jgi:hypothetical protein